MLYQTQSDNNHEHLVNIDTNTQQGECSRTKRHTHFVVFDAQANAYLLQPADDGHTHDIVELQTIEDPEPPAPKLPSTDEEVIATQTTRYQEAYEAERVSIEQGQECVAFREGDQWTNEIKNKLASANRACLTINHVAPMVETLSGVARQNRTDIKVFPVENGDQFTADVLTQAIKQILTKNEFDYEEIDVFEDEVTAGRGVFEVYPDFDENIEGDIKVKHVAWDMVTIAPHMRKDLSDAEYTFKWKWISEEQLKNLYPDRKTDIDDAFVRFDNAPEDVDTLTQDDIFLNPLYTNSKTKQVKLLECESKEYYNLNVYVDAFTGSAIAENELPKPLSKQLKTLRSLNVLKRRLYRMRKTVTAGQLVLEDEYIDTPDNSFSIIVVYAYKRGLYFEGKVERVKDAQRELNKRRSQTVDIINTTINNGWFYEDETFKNAREEENFKNNSSSAGFVIKIDNIERPPHKVEAGKVERGIVELEVNSQRSFREISNINTELLGQAPSYQSGIALQHQQRQALIGNEYLFDNLTRGKKELGRRLIGWIQEIYTPERIARLVLNQATVEKVFIEKQQLQPQDQQQVQMFIQKVKQMLSNQDLTNYDVAIGENNSTPTTQLANLQIMQQLAQSGVPIPPTALLELAPIPNKEAILKMLQEQQQREQQIEKGKQQTEIQKTLIAHQG